jgi:hypothetical protein
MFKINDTLLKIPLILLLCVCVGGDDVEGMDGADDMVRDASFQQDPEHFDFSCLSSEETWNYLDSQAREASREIKVSHWLFMVHWRLWIVS